MTEWLIADMQARPPTADIWNDKTGSFECASSIWCAHSRRGGLHIACYVPECRVTSPDGQAKPMNAMLGNVLNGFGAPLSLC